MTMLKFGDTKLVLVYFKLIVYSLWFSEILCSDHLDFQNNLPAQVVWGVPGKDVELPCDVTPPTSKDSVNMLFWFKDSAGIPLYSLDARGGALHNGLHLAMTGDLGSRSFFLTDVQSNRGRLRIHNVQYSDEGIFRCRVDFTNSPTRNFRVNLTLVVQPSEPKIFDAQGREVIENAGPFLEGHELFLSCQVNGGRPNPAVSWWQNNSMIDSVVDTTKQASTTVNQLFIPRIERSMKGAKFECRTTAHENAGYKIRQISITVYLKPQRVKILTANELLSTQMPQLLKCQANGSYPPAKITWLLGNRILRDVSVTVSETEESTTSILTLNTQPEDDGKDLICRADNPRFPGGTIEDRRVIRVAYPPRVSVHLKENFSQSYKEGDNVTMICKSKAMPPVFKFIWFHNGHFVHYNESAGTIPQDHVLELKNISKNSEGEYACSAANSEGETTSEPLRLRVQYAPRCREGFSSTTVGAVPLEPVLVRCHVDASPGNVRFSWTYNNSRDVLPVQSPRVNNNGLSSQLQFTPGAGELGTLACWASNDVGRQINPCFIHLVPADLPEPPKDCIARHPCPTCIEIICEAGSDGGLHQSFLLEVNELAAPPEKHLGSTTLSDQGARTPVLRYQENEPVFRLDTLQPGREYQMQVYAVNAKGRSEPPVQLGGVVVKQMEEKRVSESSNFAETILRPPSQTTALLFGAVIAAAGLVIISVIVAVSVVFCRRATTPAPSVAHRVDRRSPDKLEDIELASEAGFGRDFQRRSLEWREGRIRASLYLHEGDVQRLGPDLILSPVSLPHQMQQDETMY